ncbi:helveticin J family class III bacteriocin [Lactobacillus sp. ESL0731]|uniref:helveticin J family class III bacteriocin n=1 Tax=unclassified Lactobacillus TaxID=2620435 RepID=UPI0023FA4111|nr:MULTISPECIES: helveticin J family class III bacteriocin [unclassified Lactobacillus]WEV50838.1 helveticin J family class III bacteriocin [Lactobacillus sp. ESL0700]WEV61969.1 helveticin J family class III bacteriocin [Lactobacillus sp. ESL0731]
MDTITNSKISLAANLTTGGSKGVYQNVVQKGNITNSYVYAMQLHNKNGVELNSVLRAARNSSATKPINYGPSLLNMKGLAGGHSQTWEFAGRQGTGEWFIGTKGKLTDTLNHDGINWATQIARVKVPSVATTYTTNTELPRLSNLANAGNYSINLKRSEAAVSPDYTYFLVATTDLYNNGYFSLYYLDDINTALDHNGKKNVDIKTLPCISSFEVQGLAKNIVGSIQGYDIDENKNIYISSELHPDKGGNSKTRHIYKIPWGKTEKQLDEWKDLNLNGNSEIEYKGYATEFESIQVIGENHVYLTVAYHGYNKEGSWKTLNNLIYEIQW